MITHLTEDSFEFLPKHFPCEDVNEDIEGIVRGSNLLENSQHHLIVHKALKVMVSYHSLLGNSMKIQISNPVKIIKCGHI